MTTPPETRRATDLGVPAFEVAALIAVTGAATVAVRSAIHSSGARKAAAAPGGEPGH